MAPPPPPNLIPLDAFPHAIEETEHLTIPLVDGTRLAAKLWLPAGAAQSPVPAILEYLPYRKRDGTRERDSFHHRYFAGHGYAAIRVDLRGSGESEGVLADEYLEQELADGEEILTWLAAQPWCNGSVGMIGISWGGFNGLQLAARKPPELKAVISACSTDDRYADDVHYMGGCLLGENLSWASVMFDHNAVPPDPDLVGEAWREMWLKRLEGSGLWLDKWLRRQHRTAYWKHGSICEDYGAVQIPVMAVSGWADGYSDAVFRLLANLPGPVKGLIGPWSHRFPYIGVPGPAIDFLGYAVAWWDRWLKGEANGVEAGPGLICWMQDPAPPDPSRTHRPGRWVGEPGWPSPHIEIERWRLDGAVLCPPEAGGTAAGPEAGGTAAGPEAGGTAAGPAPMPPDAPTVSSPLSLGLFAGKWCAYSAGPDLPYDQRLEDGGALNFDSAPLGRDLACLGPPVAALCLAADRPVAMVAVRLSALGPEDAATLISYGVLNLTHRDSHEHPAPLEPGRPYRVRVKLNDIGQRVAAGERLRLSVSSAYWPMAWPAPEPVRLTLDPARSHLEMPVRTSDAGSAGLPEFGPATAAAPVPIRQLAAGEHGWRVCHDLGRREAALEVVLDEGRIHHEDIDLERARRAVERYSVVGNDPGRLRGEVETTNRYKRESWEVTVRTRTVLTADARDFHIRADLDAYEGDGRVFTRSWNRKVPRDLV